MCSGSTRTSGPQDWFAHRYVTTLAWRLTPRGLRYAPNSCRNVRLTHPRTDRDDSPARYLMAREPESGALRWIRRSKGRMLPRQPHHDIESTASAQPRDVAASTSLGRRPADPLLLIGRLPGPTPRSGPARAWRRSCHGGPTSRRRCRLRCASGPRTRRRSGPRRSGVGRSDDRRHGERAVMEKTGPRSSRQRYRVRDPSPTATGCPDTRRSRSASWVYGI